MNVATTASYLLADYSYWTVNLLHLLPQQEQSFRIAVKWDSDFEKLKKANEGWYIVSRKNKSLYFSDYVLVY
jgi:inner membrane protein